jgi:hypothetical protein
MPRAARLHFYLSPTKTGPVGLWAQCTQPNSSPPRSRSSSGQRPTLHPRLAPLLRPPLMDALPHSNGAEPTHHRLLFNFPMNRRCPVVSTSSIRCLDSAPPAAAWLTISPPHHHLPTPIKHTPISASPHRACHSPPFLTSTPRAPSHRGTSAATSVHHRSAIRAPLPSRANRGRDPHPLLLLPTLSR